MTLIDKCSVIFHINILFTNYYLEVLLNEVIACYHEVSASNAMGEMTRGIQLFPRMEHDSHAFEGGTIGAVAGRQSRSLCSGAGD
jgi:hypothetical protein